MKSHTWLWGWLASIVAALYLGLPYLLPASAADVQALVTQAAPNPEARAILAAAMRRTPNPTEDELSLMRSSINEVLVTAAAREATDDRTLPSPAEKRQASAEATKATVHEAIGAFQDSGGPDVLFVLGAVVAALVGWLVFRSPGNGL